MGNFQIRYAPETTWGTTPAIPMKNFRATSAALKAVNDTVVSAEARADGQITDLVRVGVSATANIGFELSFGSLADFLAAALRSAWVTGTGFGGTEVGTDLLENGTTLKSFTLESEFSNISQFLTVKGARINTLSLSIAPGQIVTGSMDFIGKIAAIGGTSAGTGAATAAPTADVLDPTRMTGMTEGGAAVEMLGIDLQIANNLRAQSVLGQSGLRGVGYGPLAVTGSLKAYFTDSTLITKWISHVASSLAWALNDADGNSLAFSIPRIKYSDGDTPNDSGGDDVVTLPFQGILDPTTGKTIRIASTAA